MALVPFRVSGAAADQTLEHRLFQIGTFTVQVDQDNKSSGSLQNVGNIKTQTDAHSGESEQLDHVGLVVWQSAFVLAELLLRQPPFGQWQDVRVVDLGTGTGVTGIALAKAGAEVVLTDLPHITPLTSHNLELNCLTGSRAQVVAYSWGEDAAALLPAPDLVTGADIVYQTQHFAALIRTLQDLCAPHTIAYLAFKLRGRGEQDFIQQLVKADFAVQEIPTWQLHEEYADGQYQVIRVCKLGA